MTRLTESQCEILRAAACGGWYVSDDNLRDVSVLVLRDYVIGRDETDCIGLCPTDKGIVHAIRLKLIARNAAGGFDYGEWQSAEDRAKLKRVVKRYSAEIERRARKADVRRAVDQMVARGGSAP